MDAAQKSFQIQAQVRQNSEIVKNTLTDLYNWEKEVKDKEIKMQSLATKNREEDNLTLPVRSSIKKLDAKKLPSNSKSIPVKTLSNGVNDCNSMLSPSDEKQDAHNDPLEVKHKKADEIKDRGNKFVKLSEYVKAIEAYTEAIELYAQDAVYYNNRALCYLKLERYDECIQDCEVAIDIDRLAVKAYYRRMLANESLGNNMDALKDCTTVLMIEPKNSDAKRSLERINERIRKNVQVSQGPHFSPSNSNLVEITPIDKPAHKRSTKPLTRLAIADVIGPKESKNFENITISDEDIDKLFNSNCGSFEEIKDPINKDFNNMTPRNISKETEEEKRVKFILSNDSEPVKVPTALKKEDSNKSESECSIEKERSLPPAPISTVQFYSNWKGLSCKQKYKYLKSIPLQILCKILGAGFDSETLADIINTLHDFYLLERDVNTAKTLLEISKNKQVSILSLLMSNEERKVLSEVINTLKETNSLDAASAEEITKNFNI